jgi:hypothetical protein
MMPPRLPMLDPMMMPQGQAPAPAPMPGQAPGGLPGGMPGADPGMDPELMRQIAQLRLLEQMNDGLPVGTTTPSPAAPPHAGTMRRGGS